MTSLTLTARRTVLATALACVAALVTGCGPTTAPIGTAPATAAKPAASKPTTAVSTAPTGATTHTPAASAALPGGTTGPAPCPTRYLQAKVGVSQGTAGSTYTVIDFTNISSTTCTLYGYPGVSLAGGTPVSQIGLAAAESSATARTLVTLAPGTTGNALLQIAHAGNYPATQCHPVTAAYLQIFPPNQTTPIYLAYTSPTCSSPIQILTISVVQPGSGSSS